MAPGAAARLPALPSCLPGHFGNTASPCAGSRPDLSTDACG